MRRRTSNPRDLPGVLCVLALVSGLLVWSTAGAAQSAPNPREAQASHLGVYLTDIDPDRAAAIRLGEARGVEVRRVEPDSPAARAGLQVGDVLLSYNGENVLSALQIGRLVRETPAGHKVKLQYWREGKTKATTVQPAPFEPSAGPPGAGLADAPAGWTVANVPRVLMVWDNLALGIECEPLDSQLAEYFGVSGGILVREVGKGMLGDKAGLRAGDVITAIDTRSVAVPADFISYLRTQNVAPGKTLVVQIVREHKKRSVSVSLRE